MIALLRALGNNLDSLEEMTVAEQQRDGIADENSLFFMAKPSTT
jgi:hypothetical protein